MQTIIKVSLLVSILSVALLMAITPALAAFDGDIIGFVMLSDNKSLPQDTRMVVQMLEKQPSGQLRAFGDFKVFLIQGSGPYKFTFTYDKSLINPALSYALEVKVGSGTEGQYKTATPVVIINGDLPPPPINMTVWPQPNYFPEGGAGSWLLLLSALLASFALLVAGVRRRRAMLERELA